LSSAIIMLLLITYSCKKDNIKVNNLSFEKSFLDKYYNSAYSFGKTISIIDDKNEEILIKQIVANDGIDYILTNADSKKVVFFLDFNYKAKTILAKDFEKNDEYTESMENLKTYKYDYFKYIKELSNSKKIHFWGFHCDTDCCTGDIKCCTYRFFIGFNCHTY